MITRLAILLTAPSWLLVTAAATAGLGTILAVLVIFSGGIASATSADLHYQCDSAVGPDPAVTETTTTTTSAPPETVTPSDVPTPNPYAEMTVAPGETGVSNWMRACLPAMRSAPYQLQPLRTADTGFAPECARQIAMTLVGGATGSAAGAQTDPARMTAVVISRASATTATCESSSGTRDDGTALRSGGVAVSDRSDSGSCPTSRGTGTVVLPDTVAAQSLCGQRVDPAWVSAGDLVYWDYRDYRDYAPTRVGIAVSATDIVASDPATGVIAQQSIPTGPDVRVKRVLGGWS
ncbi:hypothetical protein [Nocardia sp. NPDC006630]|uniref:hypothetical protein n=1 Tax=Nocardia sp. NPDC006630 TaxID=3157181 RepID=UPI00339EDF64